MQKTAWEKMWADLAHNPKVTAQIVTSLRFHRSDWVDAKLKFEAGFTGDKTLKAKGITEYQKLIDGVTEALKAIGYD